MAQIQQTDDDQFLSAKEAIDSAFAFFREHVPQNKVRHELLEALKFDEYEQKWVVQIGFDMGRRRRVGSPFPSHLNLEQPLEEPIREFRTIFIDGKTGKFKGMENP